MIEASPLEGESQQSLPGENRAAAPRLEFPTFFLQSLRIENFRSIENGEFNFQPGLNVIIGANNAAKSAVIDALRIVFNLGTFEKKDDLIRLRSTDVFTDDSPVLTPVSITFEATFYGRVESDLTAQFYEMLCLDERPVPADVFTGYSVFRMLYRVDFEFSEIKGRYEYVRSDLRGGPQLSNPISRETLDMVRSIYLDPSRDLVNDRARVSAEIERLLLSHTLSGMDDERKLIPSKLQEQAIELIKAVTKNKHHDAAGYSLSQYAKPYKIGTASLSFVPSGISSEMFRTMSTVFSHSLHGVGKLPLSSNGLGINQLIYASIVLSRRGEVDADSHVRKFFLIEEPEAHLHPQLQDSFFQALNEITDHQLLSHRIRPQSPLGVIG